MIAMSCDNCANTRLLASSNGRLLDPDGWYEIIQRDRLMHFCTKDCLVAFARQTWSETDATMITEVLPVNPNIPVRIDLSYEPQEYCVQ